MEEFRRGIWCISTCT